MSKRLELTGRRFGKLLVIECIGMNNRNLSVWKCKCDCGKEHLATGNNLMHNRVQSCGCLRKGAKHNVQKKKHGDSYTPLYKVWIQMNRRCSNIKSQAYVYYGGRGITVCDEWSDRDIGYLNFKIWALENGYKQGLTIERIDVNGNYCPQNCSWVTRSEQRNNTRKTIWIERNGERHNIQQWSVLTGINAETIRHRYHMGYPIEKILQKGRIK